MWVLDSKTAKILGQLSVQQTKEFGRWWRGKASYTEVTATLNLFQRVHTQTRWFGCECNGEFGIDANGDSTIPVLAPVLKDKTYFVTRLKKRAPHKEGCTFYFDQVEPVPGDDVEGNGDVPDMGLAPSFLLETSGTKIAKRGKPVATHAYGGKKTASVPALATKLWWLAQSAGWQTCPAQRSAVTSLLDLAEAVDVGGQPLSRLLRCVPKAWTEGWMDSDLKRAKKGAVRWWICMLASVDLKTRKAVVIDRQGTFEITVAGELRICAGDASPSRFPMLALVAVKRVEGVTLAHKLYAHPVASTDHWLLIDSNLERQTLDDLMAVSEWLKLSKGIRLSIDKPLFGWNGTGERPDFVLTRHGEHDHKTFLVVETMGFDDAEYLARKQDMRGKLHHVASVYWDMRASDPDASKLLRSAVARWAMGIR